MDDLLEGESEYKQWASSDYLIHYYGYIWCAMVLITLSYDNLGVTGSYNTTSP